MTYNATALGTERLGTALGRVTILSASWYSGTRAKEVILQGEK